MFLSIIKKVMVMLQSFHKESWASKNWYFEPWCWRRLLRVPWTARRSVSPQGNQSWTFIERTDAEAEVLILWSPDAKDWLIGKDTDAGKDLKQEKKETTEDEMVGCHHRLDGHGFGTGSWWWIGRPGVLQSMGLQRVGHNWSTELNLSIINSSYRI